MPSWSCSTIPSAPTGKKASRRDISIDLTISDGKLVVTIRDFGGGFDPGKLPYSLEADPSGWTCIPPTFEDYQKRNGFKRFGMGIYVAKKTFDEFRLVFLDETGPADELDGRGRPRGPSSPCPWARARTAVEGRRPVGTDQRKDPRVPELRQGGPSRTGRSPGTSGT